MAFNSILLSLIEGINSTNQSVIVSWGEVELWPVGALEKLVKVGILVPMAQAKSVECVACECRCFSEVIIQKSDSLTRAFVVCGDPEKQSYMGRIEIPLQRLQQ